MKKLNKSHDSKKKDRNTDGRGAGQMVIMQIRRKIMVLMKIRTTLGQIWDQKRVESQNIGFGVSYDPRALRND